MRVDTEVQIFDEKQLLIYEKPVLANITEVSTSQKMSLFPQMREQMKVFRFLEKLTVRSGYFKFTDPLDGLEKIFKIQDSQRVLKGSSFYGSESRERF